MWSPVEIPSRKPGWEHAYAELLQRQAETVFAWGKADCLTRVADLCESITGANPLPKSMRRYRTAAGAARVMARLGFADVGEALAATFPETARAKARRGDCGVAEVHIGGKPVLSTFIIIGTSAVGSNERGPVVIPTMSLKRTFRIG